MISIPKGVVNTCWSQAAEIAPFIRATPEGGVVDYDSFTVSYHPANRLDGATVFVTFYNGATMLAMLCASAEATFQVRGAAGSLQLPHPTTDP